MTLVALINLACIGPFIAGLEGASKFPFVCPWPKIWNLKIKNLDIESKFEFLPDGSPSWSGVGCLLDFFVSFLLKLILKLYREN